MSQNSKSHGARGQAKPEPTTVQIPIVRIVELVQFMPQVLTLESGHRQLHIVQPNGEVIVLNLSAEQAADLGHALAAPSVQVAAAHEMPKAAA